MVKRLLALFLLVNVVGIAANLPRIIGALDGAGVGASLSRWAVGVGTATGDFIDEATADPLTPEEVASIQEDLRAGSLDDPLDDEHVAALVDLWHVLMDAGARLQADELRDLLADEGVDVTDPEVAATSEESDAGPEPAPVPVPSAGEAVPLDGDGGRSALEALESAADAAGG